MTETVAKPDLILVYKEIDHRGVLEIQSVSINIHAGNKRSTFMTMNSTCVRIVHNDSQLGSARIICLDFY